MKSPTIIKAQVGSEEEGDAAVGKWLLKATSPNAERTPELARHLKQLSEVRTAEAAAGSGKKERTENSYAHQHRQTNSLRQNGFTKLRALNREE